MNRLPDGYSARPIAADDVDSITALVNTYLASHGSDERQNPDRLRAMLSMPGFDVEASTRVVVAPSGEFVAAGMVIDVAQPHVSVTGAGIVLEEHQGKGIGSALHDWMEETARGAIEKAPEGARVVLQQSVNEGNAAADEFLTSVGYRHARHFWRMAIDLADAAEETGDWPEGFTLDTLDPDEDLDPVVEATIDAFRDHYGHVEGSFEEQLERIKHRMENDPLFDASLHYLARAGDEIVAVCFCAGEFGGDESIGYVNALGVRRDWRRKGLALALLRHAFGELKRRRRRRAMLHVDAESLTGATRVYEKAGMSVDELSHLFELELRPGIDLAKKAAD